MNLIKETWDKISHVKVRSVIFKTRKRKIISSLIILYFCYSIAFTAHNWEPATNFNSLYGSEIQIYNSGQAYKGYNVFMIGSVYINPIMYVFGGQPLQDVAENVVNDIRNIHLVIMDMDGNVVLSRPMSYEGTAGSLIGGLSPVEVINSTTLWVANGTGGYLWNLKNNVMQTLDIYGHHEVEYNSNNNTIFVYQNNYFNNSGITYAGDIVVEYDLNSNIVWTANISEYLNVSWICPMLNDEPPDPLDYTHSNSISYDVENDIIYCNVRNLDTMIAIDHKTKDLLFSVGRHGQYTMYDINGNEVPKLFSHSHATKKIAENTFITFDNDQHNLERNYFEALPLGNTINTWISRPGIVEFTINDTTMTANQTWVWRAPNYMIQPMWGDAYRLPNGDRFGCFGAPKVFRAFGFITDKGPQLVELNSDGQIVWKATFRSMDGGLYGIYRCMRLDYNTWKFLEGY